MALVALAALILASSASALSQRGHVFAGTFPAPGAAVQLKEPAGVAVSEATGNVYVVDSGHNRVVEFGPAPGHKFIRTWGWGVKTGAKGFEICEEEATCHVGIAGHAAGQLHGAQGIAIDQSTNKALDPSAGDVYVETVLPYEEEIEGKEFEFENTIIEKYQPNGEPTAKGSRIRGYKEKGFSLELFEEEVHGLTVGVGGKLYVYNEEDVIEYTNDEANKTIALIKSEAENEERPGIAVDSTGSILYLGVAGPGRGEPPSVIAKEKVVKEGEELIGEPLIEALSGEQSSAVAVDEANNQPIVDNVEAVSVFDTTGELVERFGEGHLQRGSGIAATRAGDVFVADSATGLIDEFAAEPPGAPQIDELSVAELSSSGALLGALIDPTNLATTYTFRYSAGAVPKAGETCTGACVEVPVPAGQIAAQFGDVAVSQPITGLAPATLYHYRVIAFNASAAGGVESAEQKFKTQPVVLGKVLPDGRRWEVVSPVEKNGASIEAQTKEGGLIEASEDGGRVTYVATGAFPGAEGNRAPEITQVLAERGEGGWANTDIDIPQITGQGVTPGGATVYRAFSSDLRQTLAQPFGNFKVEKLPLSPEATESTPYLRDATGDCFTPTPGNSFVAKGCFSPVLTANNVPAEGEIEGVKKPREFGGHVNTVTADASLSHIVLAASGANALSSEPAGPNGNIYDYYEGKAHLASILPNGKPAGEKPKSFLEPTDRPELGDHFNVARALSSDGMRLIWSTRTNGTHHIYMRDMAKGETIQLDVPEAGAETVATIAQPKFQTASADGSRIFFTDEQRLTTDSSAVPLNGQQDLYECQVLENAEGHLECDLSDLTADPHPGQPADVLGLTLGTGANGAIYFVANGVLAAGAQPGHCVKNEESANRGLSKLSATCSLYVEPYDTESKSFGPAHLIATLSVEDENDWNDAVEGFRGTFTSHLSPDGNLLTFVSDRSLTGYHNTDVRSGRPDTEVFLYNASTQHLTCVSCNPNGARPTGTLDDEFVGEGRGLLVDRPLAWVGRWISGTIPAWTHLALTEAPYDSRVVRNDGRTFFTSAEALVPQDTNGKEDVYQYEPVGVGGCTTESETYGEESEGCVSLISSGVSSHESAFLDASADGNDVFFVTEEQLAPADTDTNFDVYDATPCGQPGARECLPAPVVSPPPCEGLDECRGSSTEPGGQFAAPGSTAANGSANSTEVRVLGSIEKKESSAQKLAKALTACKKASKSKRPACERTAILKYGTKAQKLSATLKACHKVTNHKKRKSCEASARKKYGTAKKAAHRASRRGR